MILPIIWYHDICLWDLQRLLAKIHFLKRQLKQIIQKASGQTFGSFCRLQIIARVLLTKVWPGILVWSLGTGVQALGQPSLTRIWNLYDLLDTFFRENALHDLLHVYLP